MFIRFFNSRTLNLGASLISIVMLSACTSAIFGGNVKERSRVPQGATDYICEGGQHFFVSLLNSGSNAWVYLPEREVNLPKLADGRYSNGATMLTLSASSVTLSDANLNLTACKINTAKY